MYSIDFIMLFEQEIYYRNLLSEYEHENLMRLIKNYNKYINSIYSNKIDDIIMYRNMSDPTMLYDINEWIDNIKITFNVYIERIKIKQLQEENFKKTIYLFNNSQDFGRKLIEQDYINFMENIKILTFPRFKIDKILNEFY
jgi:hypothetical protein